MIKIKLENNMYMPERKTKGSVGYDLMSHGDYCILANSILKIKTGISIELPEGYEAQIRPRSGLSAKGIEVIIGTIDSDFRGEISAIFHNTTNLPYHIKNGERIAQLVINKIELPDFTIVSELSETERGVNGFGSTGT
jgi:dUTP pyrophosphatase